MVKLVKVEPGSVEIREFITGMQLTSSELLVTEVPRALRAAPEAELPSGLAVGLRKAEVLLGETVLHPIKRLGLRRAGMIFEPGLRSLDAIHVATALEARPLWVFLTYDKRQAEAARQGGLRVRSPGA